MRYIFFAILFCALPLKAMEYKSFDESFFCSNRSDPFCNFMFRHKESEEIYNGYKALFEHSFKNELKDAAIIPRRLHYAWLGGKSIPRIYQEYIATCKSTNPDWQITVWNEEMLAKEFSSDAEVMQKIKSLNLSKAYEKDYFLFKVLEKYGGIFLDVDYVCLQSFDEISRKYTNFFVLEPPTQFTNIAFFSLSMVGSAPKSQLLQSLYHAWEKYYLDPKHTKRINDYFDNVRSFKGDLAQTSMGLGLLQYCREHDCDRVGVFPPTYFNPIFLNDHTVGMNALQNFSFLDQIKYVYLSVPIIYPYRKVHPETIAVQDWHEGMNLINIYEIAHERKK